MKNITVMNYTKEFTVLVNNTNDTETFIRLFKDAIEQQYPEIASINPGVNPALLQTNDREVFIILTAPEQYYFQEVEYLMQKLLVHVEDGGTEQLRFDLHFSSPNNVYFEFVKQLPRNESEDEKILNNDFEEIFTKIKNREEFSAVGLLGTLGKNNSYAVFVQGQKKSLYSDNLVEQKIIARVVQDGLHFGPIVARFVDEFPQAKIDTYGYNVNMTFDELLEQARAQEGNVQSGSNSRSFDSFARVPSAFAGYYDLPKYSYIDDDFGNPEYDGIWVNNPEANGELSFRESLELSIARMGWM